VHKVTHEGAASCGGGRGEEEKINPHVLMCALEKRKVLSARVGGGEAHKTRRRAVGAPSLAKCNSEKLREMFVIGIVVLSALVASGSEGDESEKEKRAARARALFR